MRFLLVCVLFSAPNAFAADTSGCTPLAENTKGATTSLHNELSAELVRPNRGDCWNANESAIHLNYRFVIGHDANSPNVKLWVKVNGKEQTVRAYPECRAIQNNYGASRETVCNAAVSVPAPRTGSVHVEVAPQLNDNWDTGGYDHNVAFDF
jgi:hypothetical protein